ncbi:MAG: response regulator [Planctomycetes bacterium]|nr:response regulator [Planctomycetota bacterium]
MADEIILLDLNPETRMLLSSLLERDGYRVTEVLDPSKAWDVVRSSRARTVLTTPEAASKFGNFVEQLREVRPDMEVLAPASYGGALLDGALDPVGMSEFARDALLLLTTIAEEGTRQAQRGERQVRLSELTAIKLGMARSQVERTAAVAALAALGPVLASFRFSAALGQLERSAEDGLGRDVRSALAAAATLRSPYNLKGPLKALDEHVDGRGRPHGLAGDQIPLTARVVAVARDYCRELIQSEDPAKAADAVRGRAGSVLDPKVVDAFFLALRDEHYVQRLEQGRDGAHVAVVDGDPASLAVAELQLSAAGFRVTTYSDGLKACEALVVTPPDVVLSETVLPRMDGISLLLKLRRTPSTRHVPVIFTAAKTDPTLLNKAIKLGAKDLLPKPLNFEVLVAKLRGLAGGKQARQESAQGGGVRGDLGEMPLRDFLLALSRARKTAKVVVEGATGKGEIFLEHGHPVAAFADDAEGPEAVRRLLEFEEGSFALFPTAAPALHNLGQSMDTLLSQQDLDDAADDAAMFDFSYDAEDADP